MKTTDVMRYHEQRLRATPSPWDAKRVKQGRAVTGIAALSRSAAALADATAALADARMLVTFERKVRMR